MKPSFRIGLTLALLGLLVAGVSAASLAAELPKGGLPLLSMSAGQSNATIIVNALADRIGLKYDYCDCPTVEQFAAGVGMGDFEEGPGHHLETKSGAKKGTPYKTVIFALGASLKGMGASGLSTNEEVARVKKIVDYCKKNNILIIAAHIEGRSRRGKPGSDNEVLIDAVVPSADYIIVTADGDFDQRFTNLAKKRNIPMSIIKQTTELGELLKKVFNV